MKKEDLIKNRYSAMTHKEKRAFIWDLQNRRNEDVFASLKTRNKTTKKKTEKTEKKEGTKKTKPAKAQPKKKQKKVKPKAIKATQEQIMLELKRRGVL